MQCPNCGHQNTRTTRFCARCGFDMNAAAAAPRADADVGPTDATPPRAPTPATPWGPAPSAGTAPTPPLPGPYRPPPPPPNPPQPNPYAPPGQYGPPPGPYGPPPGPYVPPAPGNWPPPPPSGQWDPSGYPPPPGYPPPYGYTPAPINGLAIASLVLSLLGWVFCIGSVAAIILGFVARSQIAASGGRQTGTGLAKAGIILGFVGIAVFLLIVATNNGTT